MMHKPRTLGEHVSRGMGKGLIYCTIGAALILPGHVADALRDTLHTPPDHNVTRTTTEK